MREDRREVDQLIEQIDQSAALGTAALMKDPPAAAVELEDRFFDHDRFDDEHAMRFEERGDFAANRGQRAVLDFNQRAASNGVNPKAIDADLAARVLAAIVFLELAVKRGFHACRFRARRAEPRANAEFMAVPGPARCAATYLGGSMPKSRIVSRLSKA